MQTAVKTSKRETWQSLGIIAVFIFGLSIYLQANKPDLWKVTDSFQIGRMTLYGHEGKFGIVKVSNPTDTLFKANRGGLYYLYFWGRESDMTGKYKLTATHKDSGQTVQLYEWPITRGSNDAGATAQSGGRFGLSSPGLWKLEVFLNDKPFDKLIVDVKP